MVGRGLASPAPSGDTGGACLLDPDLDLLGSAFLVSVFLLGWKVLLLLLAGTRSGGYVSL